MLLDGVRSVPLLWGNLLLIQESSNMDFSADKCLKLVLTLVMCSNHMFHGYPACCSHHMCGVHTPGYMDSMCLCGCHMVVCYILVGQPTHCSWPCAQWLHPDWPVTHRAAHVLSGCLSAACCLLLHGTLLNIYSNIGIILCFDFCATSDKYLLPSSGKFTHVIWVTDFVQYFNTRFVAFMNLPYADETSGSVPNRIFRSYIDPKDIFSDILRCCVESFETIFGWSNCFMSPMSATCGSMFV